MRIIAVVACCALMFPFQSCTDLEPDVFSDLTPANFPVNEGEVVSSYLSAYTRLYPFQNHNSYMSMQQVASDETMIPQRGSDWFDGGLWLRAHRHESTADDGVFNNAWIFLYQGALQCNSVIALLKTTDLVPEAERNQFIAELRSLRAYWYFQLADSYGDVPLVTDESDPSITEPTATPRADVFNFVVSELNAAAPDLSRSTDTDTYGKINFWANRALLSRVLLNAEVHTGSAQWAAAEAAADEVINGGQYSLTSDYFENFDPDNDNAFNSTSENMWVIPYDAPSVAGGFNLVQMTLHYGSQQTFNTVDQPWNGYCTLQEFYDSYDDDDLRKGVSGNQQIRGNFLAGPQFASDGVTPIIDAQADDPGGPELVFTPEINAHFPNAHRQAGARVFKYGFENGTVNSIRNDFPIIRYAEVLMNKAEAMRNQGSAGSSMFVNMVRTRAGLDDVGDNMTDDEFLAERGREFFFEATRRQDLIRFGAYTSPWAFKDQSSDTDELFPIPLAQLNANSNLMQNAGY